MWYEYNEISTCQGCRYYILKGIHFYICNKDNKIRPPIENCRDYELVSLDKIASDCFYNVADMCSIDDKNCKYYSICEKGGKR